MRTRFATGIPPVSMVWFHRRPHSRRSISARALKPARSFPHGIAYDELAYDLEAIAFLADVPLDPLAAKRDRGSHAGHL